MTIRRVLGLGTYPIVKPIHGGQRRVDAIRRFYGSIGINYTHACVYDSVPYGPPLVGPHDIPMIANDEFGPVALTGDLLSGLQAERDAPTLNHFHAVLERTKPDALQLEHPFMWPLAKRLRDRNGRRLPIIYSSHNVEAPLKHKLLTSVRAPPDLCRRICHLIDEMEAELSQDAALIVCVSASDREHYLPFNPPAITIVPNGVDRPPAERASDDALRSVFGGNRFLFMVGSAYLPNIEGFCECVARDGMFFCPPTKSVAACGGVCDGVRAHTEFQRFRAANSARVQFYPTIDDDEMWTIKDACHGVMLPILTGGGSNLKAAEALALGKWVVATPMALRGFETFIDADGVILVNDRQAFRRALAQTLRRPPLEISDASRKAREGLYWNAAFANSSLAEELSRL